MSLLLVINTHIKVTTTPAQYFRIPIAARYWKSMVKVGFFL